MRTTCGTILAAVAMALVSAWADGLTPMYGKASGTGGDLSKAVTWYSDEAMTSTANVITPWQSGSNTCRYAILGCSKLNSWGNPPAIPDVPFCFGTDGVTIGSSVSKRADYNFSCNTTFDFPQLTIYSGRFMANTDSSSGVTMKGNCTFVKTSESINFVSAYINNATAIRGWRLAGTYVAAEDVDVNHYLTMQASGDGNGYGFFECSGDFSAFKGRLVMSSSVPDQGANNAYYEVRLLSPTALGDTSYPRTDAVRLVHRSHLIMSDDVIQDGSRGISLAIGDGQFGCLDAAANTAWTLKAPFYNSKGTLKKIGAGTVTLAGTMQCKDIEVTEGTLVIGPGSAFNNHAHITVKAGARLVSKVGTTIPSYTLEEGGVFNLDFTVPYENGATTALDFTGMSAEDYAIQTKPIGIALSQPIPLPLHSTNRLALVRFNAALGVTASDFTDVTAKSYERLPTTWFEAETANGVTTIYLVARPAVKYDVEAAQANRHYGLEQAVNWSDGLAPHDGADYYSDDNGVIPRTGGGGILRTFDFGGESFTGRKGLWNFAEDFYIKELRLPGDSTMKTVHATGSPDETGVNPNYKGRILRGTYDISASATDANPANIMIDRWTTYADMRQTLTGTGTLKISTEARTIADGGWGVYPVYFSCVSDDFAGRILLTTDHNAAAMDMYVTNGFAFGGPLPAYSANAVRVEPKSTAADGNVSITATADTTIDAANRGWYMTSGTLGASNGVTFVFAPPTLTLTGKLCKTGGGTLALGCDTVGAGTDFAVKEGFVKALSAGCCTNLNLTVSAGAGIKVNVDAAVATKGLVAKSILPETDGGKILVAVDRPEEEVQHFSAAVCTVPSTQSDLSNALELVPIKSYCGRIEKDTDTYASEGLVVYKSTWSKQGLSIIFR